MSSGNFLDKLLDGEAVEWKALGEVTLPTTNIRWRDADRAYRYIDLTSVSIETKKIADTPEITFSNAPSRAQKLVEKNDVIFATTRPTQQRYCLIDDEYAGEVASTGYCVLRAKSDEVLPKWILYWIASTDFKTYVEENQSGSAYPAISDAKVKEFKIPIPCPENPKKSLEIQAEIVRILDTFTELTTELTTELNLRKKQYNHYRDQLLSFENGEVEWKTLGEVALDFGRGKSKHRPRNDEKLYGGDIPFIQTGDIRNAAHVITQYSQTYSELGLIQSKLWPKGTLCVTIAANIAETSILGFDACFPDSVIGFIANPEKTSSGYVEYLLSSLKTKLEEKGQGSAQSNINLGTFENLKLPFPSLAEQARIVAILDKFDALTTSLTEGLPCEIELRQKQYDYYRDLLLRFPKPTQAGECP
ncbi:restriction endonuclease subunit S [Acidithiobacillus sp. HP-6]|uniref:restriction endonuclease subunit S n=1 Tax=unclassified Acidithiobacillus TaxID=2614800 RepID=UPI0018798A0E|nr:MULTISPECIES: restriction endonuclease subunit S [unclassified Acidithiobacillus]MBE7562462.1 restriction endonuclease subunit S [Acidithiobacillus sp. HP-6]MBE7569316.1 restriction endonuclease subunit S [Acidithiobacillus sp. HP-2]